MSALYIQPLETQGKRGKKHEYARARAYLAPPSIVNEKNANHKSLKDPIEIYDDAPTSIALMVDNPIISHGEDDP